MMRGIVKGLPLLILFRLWWVDEVQIGNWIVKKYVSHCWLCIFMVFQLKYTG